MAKHPFPWHDAFIAALREVPVLTHAARVCGIDRSTAWRRMQADPDFKAAVEEAMEEGVDRAEQEAFRRGVVGFEEPVVHQGRVSYLYERYIDEEGKEGYRPVLGADGQPVPLTVRKHSDMLLALVLKGRRKKVYAERTELTGADGESLKVDDTTRAARAAQLFALAQKRKEDQEQFGDLA